MIAISGTRKGRVIHTQVDGLQALVFLLETMGDFSRVQAISNQEGTRVSVSISGRSSASLAFDSARPDDLAPVILAIRLLKVVADGHATFSGSPAHKVEMYMFPDTGRDFSVLVDRLYSGVPVYSYALERRAVAIACGVVESLALEKIGWAHMTMTDVVAAVQMARKDGCQVGDLVDVVSQ